MINSNDTDILENKIFDRFLSNQKSNMYLQGRIFHLTRNYLTNPLVLHELDGNLYESKDLRKFQSEYIATTLEVGRLGFNMVFTVRLTKEKSKTEI